MLEDVGDRLDRGMLGTVVLLEDIMECCNPALMFSCNPTIDLILDGSVESLDGPLTFRDSTEPSRIRSMMVLLSLSMAP